jgi:DNA repair exonuclease SbcCD ATPase subunit
VAEDEPRLARSVFGYTSRSIKLMLDDQEERYGRRLESQARLAQQRAADLQGQLDAAKDQIQSLTEELRSKEEARAEIQAELQETAQALREEREQIASLRASVGELGAQVRAASEIVDRGTEAVSSVANLEAQLEAAKDELRMKSLETWSTEQENSKLRREITVLHEQLREQEAEIQEDGGVAPTGDDPVARLVAREMSGALDSVVTDVVQQVRRSSIEQLEEAERLRRETRAELDRLVALRESTAPLIRSVQTGMQRARSSIDELPDRMAGALAPLTESLDSLVEPIRGLAEIMASDPAASEASEETPTIQLPESDHVELPESDPVEHATSDDGGTAADGEPSEPWIPPPWTRRSE